MVFATGNDMVPGARLAEMRLKKGEVTLAQIGTGIDAEPVHPLGSLGPDAVEPTHLQRSDKGSTGAGRDDALPVGLVLVRRQLGEELVVGNARRGSENC